MSRPRPSTDHLEGWRTCAPAPAAHAPPAGARMRAPVPDRVPGRGLRVLRPGSGTSSSGCSRSWTSASTRPRRSTTSRLRAAGRPHFHAAGHRGAQGGGAKARAVEPVPARRRSTAPGSSNCDYAPLAEIMGRTPHRSGGLQLLGARHRQHGGAAPVRHPRAEGALAAPAARRRDPLRLRDDRAGRGLLGRHQHRAAHRARRRRLRAQRPQVVDDRRHAPELQDPDRDGQDRPRRARPTSSSRWCSCRSDTPGLDDRAQPAGLRLPRPPRATASSTSPTCACPSPTSSPGRATGFAIAQARLGPGPHPPLHARDRRGRAGARADVRARGRARDLRQAGARRARTSATGSPRRASSSRWRGCSC